MTAGSVTVTGGAVMVTGGAVTVVVVACAVTVVMHDAGQAWMIKEQKLVYRRDERCQATSYSPIGAGTATARGGSQLLPIGFLPRSIPYKPVSKRVWQPLMI